MTEQEALLAVIPLSRGGTNDLSNLAIVHQDVNVAKASMTLDEFRKVCADVVHADINRPCDHDGDILAYVI